MIRPPSGGATPAAPPGDARPDDPGAAQHVADAVRVALAEVGAAEDPELAHVLDQLADERRRRWSDAPRARRLVAELQALFEQAAFRRTKRAERGRRFAQLVVVAQLEPALGVASPGEGDDAEQHLKRIRRALRPAR